MTDVESVRRTLDGWLRPRFPALETMDSFDFAIPAVGSTAIFLSVIEIFGGRSVAVRVMAPLLLGVSVTDDLLRYVGGRSGEFVLGNLALVGEGRFRMLVFSDALLAETVTEEELLATVFAVATIAENLDDDLQERFGGRLLNG